MGVQNRQRRAAKKKRSASGRKRPSQERFAAEPTPELARSLLLEALSAIEAEASAAAPLADGPNRPVLHRRAEQVDAATEQLLPELQTRPASITNAQGWVAGRAAADRARLDVAEPLEAAG